jgi:hydrogenase maturation protease
MKIWLLVIGYGNELRSDDGVGPAAARAVAAWDEPGVRAIATHQLTPELADAIAGAEEVVFLDARIGSGEVVVQRVTPSSTASALGHASDPGWLLALTELVHSRVPPAWLVTIPADNLEPGERLSATAARGVADALGVLRSISRNLAAKVPTTTG